MLIPMPGGLSLNGTGSPVHFHRDNTILTDAKAPHPTPLLMGKPRLIWETSKQSGLLSPMVIPKNSNIIEIDLQDFFFTIPLYPRDSQRFAFNLPSRNFQRSYQQYQ